jgi:protein-S-isoprenylcysteine O-methyltransferase Ste14
MSARRILVFAFGIASYACFLASVAWGVVFVGDLGFLKSVDSGRGPVSRVTALVIDVALIVLFGVQHSAMARRSFKARLAQWLPDAAERSFYVLVSSVALAALFFFWQPIPLVLWDFSVGWERLVLVAMFWIAWALVLASSFLVDHFDLFGLRQVTRYLRGQPYRPPAFKDSWAYRHVRHPLMTSFLLAFWATPRMTIGHALFALGMTLYILAGIRFEEKDLLRSYGQQYAAYRKRVPMLFPWRVRR